MTKIVPSMLDDLYFVGEAADEVTVFFGVTFSVESKWPLTEWPRDVAMEAAKKHAKRLNGMGSRAEVVSLRPAAMGCRSEGK